MTSPLGARAWSPTTPYACADVVTPATVAAVEALRYGRCRDCGHIYSAHLDLRCDLCRLTLEVVELRTLVLQLARRSRDPGPVVAVPRDPEECG